MPMSLIETLESKSGGEVLVQRLNDIKRKVQPLLLKISESFPEYTSHDITHCERILEQLNFVIPDPLLGKLNEYEIYFLVASVYLHDIGMVNFPALWGEEIQLNPEFTEENKLIDQIREKHHLRSESICINKFKDFTIEDEHQARIIGRICRGHRKEDLHDLKLFQPDRIYGKYPINIPLLASFLKIGDELDLTFERTPQIIYENVPPRDNISKDEWKKHLSISGVALHPDDPLKIKCFADCKNPKIHRVLKGLETKINNQLSDLPNHLHQYREFRKDIPRLFLMEIEHEGYTPYDLKFSLQEKEIIKLLMGEKLYKRKEESIREILKNSLDACRLRKSLFRKNGVPFTPLIEFELTPDKNRLILTDNGIGMDKEVIERYFINIGQSFYKSHDFLEMEVDFSPVNELGIGILSCFMMANRIVIETKMDDSNPIVVEIDDVSDYFFVKTGDKKITGTTTTLFLKEKANEKELKEEIRNFARHLEIPVKIILPDGNDCTIEDIGYKPDDLLGNYNKKYGFFINRINNDEFEGIIGILSKKDENFGLKAINTWILPSELTQLIENEEIERHYISHQGIFIDHTDITPKWLKSEKIYIDLNLKRNVLSINVARNEIIHNEKFIEFKNHIELEIIKVIENFLNNMKSNCELSDVNTFSNLSENFFKQYVSYHHLKDDMHNELINLYKKFIYFKSISEDGIKYINYDEIKKSVKPFRLIQAHYNIKDHHLLDIYSNCSNFSDRYILHSWNKEKISHLLFEEMHSTSFFELLGIYYSSELKGIIPKSWKLVGFKYYRTSRFMEFSGYNITYLNRDNKFIDLIIDNIKIIDELNKIALEGFFRALKLNLKNNFTQVIASQKGILKWFIDANLIREEDIDNFILTVEDFPQYCDTHLK